MLPYDHVIIYNSDIMATDNDGQSPLHLIANSNVESIHAQRMITLLLEHGCSVGGWGCLSMILSSDWLHYRWS